MFKKIFEGQGGRNRRISGKNKEGEVRQVMGARLRSWQGLFL